MDHPINSIVTPSSEVLSFGTEDGRGLGKVAVVRTSVSFSLHDDEKLSRCAEAMRSFATVLRGRAPCDVFYGWEKLKLHRNTRSIELDIVWYDLDYFERRKHAHRSRLHEMVLRDFGVGPDDLTVVHGITNES